jgi:hypothetical protein
MDFKYCLINLLTPVKVEKKSPGMIVSGLFLNY